MTPKSLEGLHLLITRPIDQAKTWANQLECLGASTQLMPTLAIKPIEESDSLQAITGRILTLDQYQYIIFVSQNAVNYGIEWIDQYWPQLPLGLTFLAVGQSTAQYLGQKLTQIDTNIDFPKQAMNSEALLQLPALQSVDEQKVMIFRGQGGRTLLRETLEARGALVDYCEVYRRCKPNQLDQKQLKELIQNPNNSTIVISAHSGETLRNLIAISPIEQHEWLRQQTMLLPGKRVAHIARSLGFKHIICANNATNDSMIEALHDWRKKSK